MSAPLAIDAVIGVVGAGAMGRGIAQVAATSGHQVLLYDAKFETSIDAVADILAALRRLQEKGRMTSSEVDEVIVRLRPVSELSDLAGCSMVIEAIAEKLKLKQDLFRDLELLVRQDTILATNTSSISITSIAASLARPSQLVGMHFFNPAPRMALVEVIWGLSTSPEVAATVHATALSWGKHAVHARSTPGFIVNRVARPFYAEALRLVSEGAAGPATIDALIRDSGGFPMGPFELMDLIGHDVNYAVTQSVFDAFYNDPRYAPSLVQLELVNAGRLGRKSGRGFFDYSIGATPQSPSVMPVSPLPKLALLHGTNGALARALAKRWVGFELTTEVSDGRLATIDGVAVFVSDGRTATELASSIGLKDVVVLDHMIDPLSVRRCAISVASECHKATAVIGALQAAGFQVSELLDLPALALLRTLAMLANEAADAVHYQVARASDVDTAMLKGVNYPIGPLQWADLFGPERLVQVLDRMANFYGDGRYRTSPLLRRAAASGFKLHSLKNELRTDL